MTPLYIASQEGQTETAKMLIENGANVDVPDKVCTLISMNCIKHRLVILFLWMLIRCFNIEWYRTPSHRIWEGTHGNCKDVD